MDFAIIRMKHRHHHVRKKFYDRDSSATLSIKSPAENLCKADLCWSHLEALIRRIMEWWEMQNNSNIFFSHKDFRHPQGCLICCETKFLHSSGVFQSNTLFFDIFFENLHFEGELNSREMSADGRVREKTKVCSSIANLCKVHRKTRRTFWSVCLVRMSRH